MIRLYILGTYYFISGAALLRTLLFVIIMMFANFSLAYERFHSLWDTPSLLKMDQTIVSVSAQGFKSSGKFDASGSRQDEQYERNLTWSSVLGGLSKKQQLDLKGSLKEMGVSESSLAYQQRISVEREVYQLNPFWAYGLTDKWNLGLRLPIQFSRSKVRSRTQKSESFELLSEEYATLQGKVSSSSAEQGVEEDGSSQFSETSVGDLEILSKVSLFKQQDGSISTIQSISFPSSRGKDPFDPLAAPAGDGQFDFGLGLVADYWLAPRWTLTTKAFYLWQFSDKRDIQVPLFGADDLDYIIVEDVKRDLGDVFEGSIITGFDLQQGWSLSGGFLYYYKQHDKYQGSGGEGRLGLMLLESGSEREYQVANLGFEFVRAQREEIFAAKSRLGTQINIYAPISGRNSNTSPAASLDVFYVY